MEAFMVADYNSMEWISNPAFKGGEGVFCNKVFTVPAGRRVAGRFETENELFYVLKGSCEMIFILEGEGKVLFDDTEEAVKPGMVHYCPEGHSHSLINNGSENLIFYAVVPKQ